MKSTYLSIFCAPDSPDGPPLTFVGKRDGDELLDGKLLADGAQVGKVINGILRFVEPDVSPPVALEDMRKRWVPFNWKNEIEHASRFLRSDLCNALASVGSSGGLILEVGAGPGGGNLAPLLHRCPDASVIVNDISAAVLDAWREFLAGRETGKNACFAAFDARKTPIRSESVDAVSNSGGFVNIARGQQAVREACRVLKPGGGIFSMEHLLERDGLSRLPKEMQDELLREVGGTGVAGLLQNEGLILELHRMFGGRELVPPSDGVAIAPAKHGVKLRVRSEYVIARKLAT